MDTIEARTGAHQTQAQSAHASMVSHFLRQVRHGIDEPLSRGPSRARHTISELLGDCGIEARSLLLTACMQAANRDRVAFVAETLCAFAAQVARDYADDYLPEAGLVDFEAKLIAALAADDA